MKILSLNKSSKTILFGLSALLVVSVVAAVFVQPAAAATCKFKHKVQPGETLSSIADLYGADWREIAEANKLKEPYVLQVDQVLCIPSGSKPADTDSEDSEEVSSGPVINVQMGLVSILVEVKGLAKKTVYHLLVGNYPGSYTTNIARFKTNSNGYYKDYFKLPNYYYLQAPRAQVCVKNVWTDKTGCTIIDNLSYYNNNCSYFGCQRTLKGLR
ncbi:MAG: LysM peptidoglycan-binding domain-containing protein [Anaerolineales bacterium]|jgi:LysM repeat protein